MKGITYCGACADYDIKKHRCKRGAKLESNPQDKFLDDCPLPTIVPVARGRRIEREEKPIFPHELVGQTEAVADYLLDSGVTAQEWISVKDRLPKNDEIVIICTDKNFIYAGELIGDTWFLDNDSWTATVTHWMPLPQPPKGE